MNSFINSQKMQAQEVSVMIHLCCPHCKGHLLVGNDPGMVTVACKQCGNRFNAADGMKFLDWIEYALRRMIVGLWVFIVHRIPEWFCEHVLKALKNFKAFLFWLIPFSAQVVRVSGWVSLWLFIWFGPAVVLWVGAVRAGLFSSTLRTGWGFVLAAGATLWFGGVAFGYGWSFFHFRGRRKERAKDSGKIVEPVVGPKEISGGRKTPMVVSR